jgi:hypothetical protein
MDAFFEGPPSLDHNTRVLVTVWVMGLLSDATPTDALAIADRRFGTIYRAIVSGTDVEVTYRLLATGSPRLLELRRIR